MKTDIKIIASLLLISIIILASIDKCEKQLVKKESIVDTISPPKKIVASKFMVKYVKVNVYKDPDIDSNIVSVINGCDTVRVIDSIMIIGSNPFTEIKKYQIITSNNIGGYVLASNLERCNDKLLFNTKPFDIKGKWTDYIDPPCTILHFRNNGKLIFKYYPSYEEPSIIKYGTYEYDGCCNIRVFLKNHPINDLQVVELNGEVTLKWKCFVYDPDFFDKK